MPTPINQTEKTAILRARANALAQEPLALREAKTVLEVIEFGLAHERYGLETAYVREVSPLEDLTPLPCTPAFIRGLVNVRGRLFPVIDLKVFFELPEHGITDLHHIILVGTDEMEFGILADTIGGVFGIPLDSIQPSLSALTEIRADYLKGVTEGRLVILDAARILADQRIVVDEEVDV